MGKLREYRTFLARAARQPTTVGAVLPTSSHVASAMAAVLSTRGTPIVVELGPGTGALSEAIRHRLPEGGRHLAIEVDTELAGYLRASKPWLEVIEGDATNLRALLNAEGITEVDAVISSIPWTLLPAQQQQRVLEAAGSVLKPDGVFTAITYLTTLWRANTAAFIRSLHASFDEVLPRSTIWRNVPPARVYVCRRPRNS